MVYSFDTPVALPIRAILFAILTMLRKTTAVPQGTSPQCPHAIPTSGPTVYVDASQPPNGTQNLSPAFVSYSIEFASFPDFAGSGVNRTNTFTDGLLSNIEAYQGARPYIRVGGKTQSV
jgi:hypothetical protein